MKRFLYKAKDATGKVVEGEVEALDANQAAKLVRDKGFVVINIRNKTQGLTDLINTLKNRITTKDVSNFTRQFATMINAGLPITESLNILKLQATDKMEPIVGKILTDVENGESLSVSFGRHPAVFSPTYVALIKAGETGGVLDKVLNRVADNLEKAEEFKGKVVGALIYPVIIIIGMIIVSFIMMVFIMPRLLDLYTQFDAELPLPTKIIMFISNTMASFWPIFLLLAIGAYFGIKAYVKTKAGRHKIDEIILKLPIIGELQQKVALADLARTLALMIGSGVPVIESIEVSGGAVGNIIIKDALFDAADQVEKGFPIAFSFAKHPDAFPYIFSQMIAVGEESGKLDDVLTKLSHIFETEADQKVKTLTAAIEPMIMIVLGLGVGFLVISVILPIYNLTNSF